MDVATPLGQEYDTNGRLQPVVYSKTDPIIKSAMAAGRMTAPVAMPTIGDILDASRRLGTEYILVIETSKVNKGVTAKAELIRDRRAIWKDEINVGVSIQEVMNPTDTARSLARTLVLKMNMGPFKGLPDKPKPAAPTIQPGQEPIVGAEHTNQKSGLTNDQLRKNVAGLVQSGKSDAAILALRDAVDAAPLDLDRRMLLIQQLETSNPSAAALEARRAAILMPEKVELRVQAAREWIKAGHSDEATKDLNEAVARDPNGLATRMLLGELSLNDLQPAKAIGHFDEIIKAHDSAQARIMRAICRGLLGGTDGMQIDIEQADKLEPVKSPADMARRYGVAADVVDRSLAVDGAEVRGLLTKIVVKPKDQSIKDQIEGTLRLVQSRSALLSAFPVPPEEKSANDRRVLSHKLLAQCLLDLQTYSATPDDDTLADARINLGEALKPLAAKK
jgi:tetratricopeptide (TPR) repeat protein